MKSLIKGAILTLRSMGFSALLKEALRRRLGIKYCYRGILINSAADFRAIRNVLLKGYEIYNVDGKVIVNAPFGELCVDAKDVSLLRILYEPLEDMYGFVNVKDAIVIDIGAYIGETALLFLSKGARRVYALEPVDRHYRYLLENISRNNAVGCIVPLNYGAWFRETILNMDYEGTATGLQPATKAPITIKVRNLGDILREVFKAEGRIDLVKMDCEGCEYSLLSLSNDDIKLAKQYIIEIHGSEGLIIDKMSECGYEWKFIKSIANLVSIYHFVQ